MGCAYMCIYKMTYRVWYAFRVVKVFKHAFSQAFNNNFLLVPKLLHLGVFDLALRKTGSNLKSRKRMSMSIITLC